MPFNCDKHGYILHGTTCLNCEREQEQITPKITPQTPRGIFDSFRSDGADAAAMATAPLLPDAQMEKLFKLRSDSADAVAMAMTPHHLLPRYAFAGMDEIRAEYVRRAAQWQAEWQRKHEADIMRALTSGQPAIFGVDYAGSYPDINLKVET